jgi:hypothetical protein
MSDFGGNGGADDPGNATLGVTGSNLGSNLSNLLMAGYIEPGTEPSYQLCKTIYLEHPLGAKMVEVPLSLAQSQKRDITITKGPEEVVKKAFEEEWKRLACDKHIFNVMRLSRIYGISAVIYGAIGVPTDRPIKPFDLPNLNIYFNVLDPLNTAGSLVLNQQPNSPDFLKHTSIAVSGQPYHRSRACVVLNEEPIYIAYTPSAFGFVGRSVYQRALFPLKSFVQSMITDDLVTRKAGLLVAMIKQVGSYTDRIIQGLVGLKRNILKQAVTGNVISIGDEDKIESIDMHNTDTAMTTARTNILHNIAAAAGMPAILLNDETFAEGFGEGTEDAKAVARYIEGIRTQMAPLYEFFEEITMYRAWSPAFYKTVQAQFPEYQDIPYLTAFYDWKNSFAAVWPNLLIEPESEQIKTDEAKIKSLISIVQILLPIMDPENKGNLVQWLQDNMNDNKVLFGTALNLDIQALIEYEPPQPEMGAGQEGGAEGGKPLEALTRGDAVPMGVSSAEVLKLVETHVPKLLRNPAPRSSSVPPVRPGTRKTAFR